VNLILLEPHEAQRRGDVTLSGARAKHLIEVLRVEPGQVVRVGVIDGEHGQATIAEAAADTVRMRCVFESDPPARPRVDLLLAVPRPKVMRRLWAQLAAIGVGRIILTNAARVERPYFDTHLLTEDVYRPLLIEGLQQARDTRLPMVSIHRQFRILVEDHLDAMAGAAVRIVADPSAAATLTDVVAAQRPDRVLLAVGPEGGWNAFELALLQAHGFQLAGIGRRTLRTDTACIALLSQVHAFIP
jgi:RsmE family RNA methyltransferase